MDEQRNQVRQSIDLPDARPLSPHTNGVARREGDLNYVADSRLRHVRGHVRVVVDTLVDLDTYIAFKAQDCNEATLANLYHMQDRVAAASVLLIDLYLRIDLQVTDGIVDVYPTRIMRPY